jgi:hypothetical protein
MDITHYRAEYLDPANPNVLIFCLFSEYDDAIEYLKKKEKEGSRATRIVELVPAEPYTSLFYEL